MRLHPSISTLLGRLVSIHAPWEGCDIQLCNILRIHQSFNSRTLGRVRQEIIIGSHSVCTVSIHAPWEGCDTTDSPWLDCLEGFNSRTLGRVRRRRGCVRDRSPPFQFTHPGKGATPPGGRPRLLWSVSIHAPWEGCDSCFAPVPHLGNNVSIHAPWEGCDRKIKLGKGFILMFQFTHPGKGATHRFSLPCTG